MKYLRDIWTSRYFWTHLARAEIRARFRNSRLGILWALLQPLLLTLLMAFIFGAVFQVPMAEFAPYVFSGLLVWEFVCGAVMTGCSSFVAASPYICQRRLPLAIYPLKNVLSTCTVFIIGMMGLLLWIAVVKPHNLGLPLLNLVLVLPLYVGIAWALAISAAVINTKYRDFQYVVGLLLQALWYVSPVFLEERLFRSAKVEWLLAYNPVAHLLNLVRAPVLGGTWPTPENYLYTLGLLAAAWAAAVHLIRRQEPQLIFYL
jgi:lipopolysaccharide transport system permease protein